MTIIEALRSGRPFRIRGTVDWLITGKSGIPTIVSDDYSYALSTVSLLSSEWEIQESVVELTESKFIELYQTANRDISSTIAPYVYAETIFNRMINQLFPKEK